MTTVKSSTFDYVVIGGGTAGCTVAARLSEHRDLVACLIEAGDMDRHFSVRVPAAVMVALGRPDLNWDSRRSPNPH